MSDPSGPEIVDGRDTEATDRALEALERSEPIAVATDTVYGLIARAADVVAVDRLFVLKRRPVDRHIAVLVADLDQAESLVELGRGARRLTERFWPGPLTLVAHRRAGALLHLGTDTTIGVRCPADSLLRAVAAGGALAATSANRHGRDTPATAADVVDQVPGVSFVIDRGPRSGSASTVVDVTGSGPAVLREGPISAEAVARVWPAEQP